MSPLASSIVLGFGSVVTFLGLLLLLTVLTRGPRATPTLMVCGRAYRLRAAAVILVLAGGLSFAVPVMHSPGGARQEHTVPAERRGPPAPTRAASHDAERGSGGVGAALEPDRPGAPEHSASQRFRPEEPFNLTGEWTVTNTVLETSYPPYRNLRLGFRLVVRQEGPAFTGAGEKYLENGRQIPVAARSPIRIQGSVATGSVLEVTFQEDGRARPIQGQFRLTVRDRHYLAGTFVSTAANASGASQWLRASARQEAPGPTHAQPQQEARVRPLPPDQGAPPVLALVAPVQGQRVTTAQLQVRGTATGASGIVRVDVQVNGEPVVQRVVPGTASVDFSEPIALRHGPNDIVVTAVDRQNLTARQRVTVTRVGERPQAPAPADEPREPVPAGGSTTREHRPALQLGMSQAAVRDLLGEPVSVEDTPKFVFWHYGPEQYVVFEKTTGGVYGWVGVSS